jgi:pyridoxine 5-phosphate synthase
MLNVLPTSGKDEQKESAVAKLNLGINIDHVATLRNARDRDSRAHPDILRAAEATIEGGADSITFHLREDRRHILDADVKRLRKELKVPINLEMAATTEMRDIALRTKPFAVCLVPEKRREVTTEGGLNAAGGSTNLKKIVHMLMTARIRVSLFVDPDAEQILAAHTLGAAAVELHTGAYAAATGKDRAKELKRLRDAARQAYKLGLEVHAGHGLNYENVGAVAAIPEITELNIGHFLVSEALFVGLTASVREMRRIMDRARK